MNREFLLRPRSSWVKHSKIVDMLCDEWDYNRSRSKNFMIPTMAFPQSPGSGPTTCYDVSSGTFVDQEDLLVLINSFLSANNDP